MKIEHFKPRRYAELELRWDNLLGTCDGNEGQPQRLQTCDTRKGDREIHLSPLEETRVVYLSTGRVEVAAARQPEVDDVRNLNGAQLVRNRNATLDALLRTLAKRLGGSGSWTKGRLQGELGHYRAKSELEEYFGVI